MIGDVRGLGLMIAVEFVKPDGAPNPAAVANVIQRCFEEKVLLLNCGTYDQAIRIIPPLVVNAAQINDSWPSSSTQSLRSNSAANIRTKRGRIIRPLFVIY